MDRKVTYFIFLLVFLTGFFLTSVTSAAQEKIAIVSLQRALNEVNQGKRAMASIKAEADSKQKQLESIKGSLKKMRDDIEKQKMVLSEDALKSKANEIQTKFIDFQNKAVEYERALKTKEIKTTQNILKNLKVVVVNLAKKEKYDMVYENSADVVLFSSTGVDITDQVIKAYNRKYK